MFTFSLAHLLRPFSRNLTSLNSDRSMQAGQTQCSEGLTFEDHDEMLPMVGEMDLVDVVVSVNSEVTLCSDQR